MNIADQNIQEYLEVHPFLAETAVMQLTLQERVQAVVAPLAIQLTAAEAAKMQTPLLLQDKYKTQLTEAAASFLPQVLAELGDIEAPLALVDAIQGLEKWARGAGLSETAALFAALLAGDDKYIAALSEAQDSKPAFVRILGWLILEDLVPKALRSHEFWQEAGWRDNHCPICGREPVLAHLRKEKEGRARFLVCDGCHAEWPFARVGCAYCGNEDLTKMHILEAEDLPAMRIDVCDACQTYIKTYNEEGREEIFLTDWATLHLDMLGEEQGCRKKGSVLLENK